MPQYKPTTAMVRSETSVLASCLAHFHAIAPNDRGLSNGPSMDKADEKIYEESRESFPLYLALIVKSEESSSV